MCDIFFCLNGEHSQSSDDKMSKIHCISLLMFFSACASTEPVVIYDSGSAISVVPYLSAYGITLPESTVFSRRGRLPINNAVEQLQALEAIYPVKSKRMSPGSVPEKSVSYPFLVSPFCIVGDDGMSMKWLVKSYVSLANKGVGCFITNVQSRRRYNTITARFPRIQFWPANVDELSELYTVSHYPVVISRGTIGQ